MKWTSVLAIYALFWALSAFICLPFGVKTPDEAGAAKVPGQADSAPTNFRPMRVVVRATILAIVLCALFVVNYINDWITVTDIDLLGPLAGLERAD